MIVKDFLVKRRWIILTFTFAAVTLATSAYLVFREIYRPKKPNDILSKYSYLFQEKHDIHILNQLMQESQKRLEVEETKEPIEDTCEFSCPKKTKIPQDRKQIDNNANRTDIFTLSNKTAVDEDEFIMTYLEPIAAPLRDEPKIKHSYHGCCMSNQSYVPHHELEDLHTGKKLRIVQFRKKSQYFLTDHCQHLKDCKRGCKCRQQFVGAVAVVVDSLSSKQVFDENSDRDNEYIEKHARLELVKYRGWCKCFNE